MNLLPRITPLSDSKKICEHTLQARDALLPIE